MARRKVKSHHRHSHRNLHYVAATVFSIVAIVHIFRLINGWPLIIGNWVSPMLLSWIAALLAGSLAVLLWKNAE